METTLNVCEVASPEGYLTNNNCNSITLDYSGDNTPSTFPTTIKDQVIKGRIEIAKTIDKDKYGLFQSNVQKPGKGFKFDIILKSTGKVISTLTTDEDGRAISDYLPYDDRLVLKHLDQTTLNLKLPRHTLAGLKFFSSKTSPDGRHYRDIYYYENMESKNKNGSPLEHYGKLENVRQKLNYNKPIEPLLHQVLRL